MSDLQDIIVSSSIKAFNAGLATGRAEGRQEAIIAAKFVQFENHGLDVVAVTDLEEELQIRANIYQSDTSLTQSAHGEEGKP